MHRMLLSLRIEKGGYRKFLSSPAPPKNPCETDTEPNGQRMQKGLISPEDSPDFFSAKFRHPRRQPVRILADT